MTQDNHGQTSKSIVRNVIYGSLTWVLPVGLSFVATPIIVRSLGNNDYGLYALVLGFISYSFTFSLGRAVTKYCVSQLRQRLGRRGTPHTSP